MRNQKYTAIFFLFYFICSLRTYIAPGSLWDFISTNYKELVYIFLPDVAVKPLALAMGI